MKNLGKALAWMGFSFGLGFLALWFMLRDEAVTFSNLPQEITCRELVSTSEHGPHIKLTDYEVSERQYYWFRTLDGQMGATFVVVHPKNDQQIDKDEAGVVLEVMADNDQQALQLLKQPTVIGKRKKSFRRLLLEPNRLGSAFDFLEKEHPNLNRRKCHLYAVNHDTAKAERLMPALLVSLGCFGASVIGCLCVLTGSFQEREARERELAIAHQKIASLKDRYRRSS